MRSARVKSPDLTESLWSNMKQKKTRQDQLTQSTIHFKHMGINHGIQFEKYVFPYSERKKLGKILFPRSLSTFDV